MSAITRLVALLQKPPARWLIAVGWSLWITNLLIQPEDYLHSMGVPAGPSTFARELTFTGLHTLIFGITCVLWFWTWIGHLRFSVSLALAACIAIGLGSATEYLQTFTPDRYPSWGDFAANYAGVLIAATWIWYKYTAPA